MYIAPEAAATLREVALKSPGKLSIIERALASEGPQHDHPHNDAHTFIVFLHRLSVNGGICRHPSSAKQTSNHAASASVVP